MPNKTENLTRKELEQLYCVTEKDFQSRDHRLCDCELTFVRRKWHPALGTGIEIRLCCLAKKVEELAGLPEGSFFMALEFQPSWEWDCDEIHSVHRKQDDGSVVETLHRQGDPPRWLRERMEKKGVPIRNLGK